jgi:uncharacterized 2Fe-2S/4Fe-4S cluster protein (DUF4445 family)
MRSGRRITFSPAETTVSVPAGYTVLDAARKAGLSVDSICGGKGTCGKCLVKILTREACELSDAGREISPASASDRRLACQTPVEDGMRVLISSEPLDTGLKGKEIEGTLCAGFMKRVRKAYLRLDPPSGPDPASDWARVTRALPDLRQPGLKGLQQLSALMHPSAFTATVAFLDNEWLSVEAGDTEKENFGLAVDLGTTTVAVYLADLHDGRIVVSGAALNEQSPFGADVVSRISYADAHPEGLATLQKAAVKTINKLLDDLMAKRSIDRENIYLITVVGNPTMLHLFLGMNPEGLAAFPFRPVFSDALTLTAFETGLNLPAHTKLEILPLVSAYVGADTVAAALAAGLDQPGPPRLLLDIGTNGEVVLAVNDKIWACSTAAGPALEGGAITFGMRAVPGAISAVTITDDVALSIIGRRSARGLCGSGLLDVVAQLLDKGLIGKTGRLQDAKGLPEGLSVAVRKRLTPGEKGRRFHLAPEVYLTQGDISQLQLAKGAMRAGIEILMAEAGITVDDVEEVLLAGAFGANLRPESLVAVGLLPPVQRKKIKTIGNAAGVGALLCLLSEEHHHRALHLARRMKCLELSLRKDFQDRFMKGMQFLRF